MVLDLRFIREHTNTVHASITKRGLSVDVDKFLAIDKDRSEIMKRLDELRELKNKASKEIATVTGEDKMIKVNEMKKVSDEIKVLEAKLIEVEKEFYDLYYAIPNLLDDTTAIGKDSSENVVEEVFFKQPNFGFTPKSHMEIGEAKNWIDSKKGTDVSGSRFWYLKGDLVLLQFAIIQYAMGHLIKNGFYPVLPPVLVREPAMFGTGFFPADKNEYYHVNPGEDDLYLVGTSEVPLTAYHRDDVLDLATPVKYVGYSPCFRREAGSYGKDLKGILRGHQFDKLEMVCFTKPEESKAMHDHMVQMEIDIWKGLGIPFRKVNCCSGDLGGAASIKRYDLEAWIPSENTYREVTSCSNIADFQCRRLNTKFIDAEGNRQLAHSLNGTVIAFSRCLIALVENFQTAEGDVIIPEVLRAYMGGREKI